MQVKSLMDGTAVTVSSAASIRAGARRMKDADVGSLAVVDNGSLVGILTERDVLGAVAEAVDLDRKKVADFMTVNPDVMLGDYEVQGAFDWMLATGRRHLPIIDDQGLLLGITSIKDVLWAVTDPAHRSRKGPS